MNKKLEKNEKRKKKILRSIDKLKNKISTKQKKLSNIISHSTVGFPLLSKISLAIIFCIFILFSHLIYFVYRT